MKAFNAIAASVILLLIGIVLGIYSVKWAILFAVGLAVLEFCSYALVNYLRQDFQWLITPEDECPDIDKEGLKKFLKHGYDEELGWVRKPNTKKDEIGKFGKTTYHIGNDGSRKNPGHESLPKIISFYGDSFPFGRQVNDNETCEWYLSKLTKTNVLNFAVGNYGLDQALLRLKREYPKNKTKVVIIGVVPSTIVRIMCMWKHYNEYGNAFGFKPRFIVEGNELKLVENIINSEDKFLKYIKYLPIIKKHDYFYKNKFKKEMSHFPYFISLLSDPMRNVRLIYLILLDKWLVEEKKPQAYPPPMKVIMEINLRLRVDLFSKNMNSVALLKKIAEEFVNYGAREKFTPVFVLMPQKDDLSFIRDKNNYYYKGLIDDLKEKMIVIDLTKSLIGRRDLDELYSDDNEYGGHYNKHGNELIAKIIRNRLKKEKII